MGKKFIKIIAMFLVMSVVFCSENMVSAFAGLSVTGEPNSTTTEYNEDGSPKQVRVYGPDGKAQKDIDYNHGGNHEFPHEHEWDWSKKPPRQPGKTIPTPCLAPDQSQGAGSTANTESGLGNLISELSGLAAVGAVVYYVISEGSRVIFPIRNLIPIP